MPRRKTIIVNTLDGKVTVKRLPLAEYANLLHALDKLPARLQGVLSNSDEKVKDSEYLLQVLPDLIADSIPEFCAILSTVTDKDKDFFMQSDLADSLDVLAAGLELNDYSRIFSAVKKIRQGHMKKQETGS